MIFLTVGTQLPFDRLVMAVDEWAHHRANSRVFAQIGRSAYSPLHMEWRPLLSPEETNAKCREASLIVGHAGVGTILTALEMGKPIIVMPRQYHFQEHRNDHQTATAEFFEKSGQVLVAKDKEDLFQKLNRVESQVTVPPIASHASGRLLEMLKQFVDK